MRLKRENWTDEDNDIAITCLLQMTTHPLSEWVKYGVVFNPIKEAFPAVTDRHIAQIVCQLHDENKLIVHVHKFRVFLQRVEE